MIDMQKTLYSATELRAEDLKLSQFDIDKLTGALTMSAFQKYATAIFQHVWENQKTSAIVYFNIANFKSYNEKFGFERGNELICTLGDLIADAFPGRLVTRIGSDQFAVICFASELTDALQKIGDLFRKTCPAIPDRLKAGVFILRDADTEITVACDRAKIAADCVPVSGRNFYRIYDEELDFTVRQKRYISENIDRAIENGWIEVYYQPVVRTLTGRVCGTEALARWNDPVYGFMRPDVFIGTLEESHQISSLDFCIIRSVCRSLKKSMDEGQEVVPVSFNLSRLDFELGDIVEQICSIIDGAGVPRDLLHVEITESVFTKNPDAIKEQIRKFHAAGFEVWMDDFGSGYSSLNVLKDFEFDLLKIDMVFLRSFSERSRCIITSIVDMAKKIGIRTLAEGVETADQMHFLRSIGCEIAQGYLIGKPMPGKKAREHLMQVGLPLEPLSMRSYYETLGRINLLSPAPLDQSRDLQETATQTELHGMPLAILEYERERFSFLITNHAFREVLKSIGIDSMGVAAFDLNDRNNPLYARTRENMKSAVAKQEVVTLSTVIQGSYCYIRTRCVARSSERTAFLCTMENLSMAYGLDSGTRISSILPLMYAMFDFVCMAVPQEDRGRILYMQDSYRRPEYSWNQGETSVRKNLRAFSSYVLPEDRARFLSFTDMDTVLDRIAVSSEGTISGSFRIQREDRQILWKKFSISSIRSSEKIQVLITIVDMNIGLYRQYESVGERRLSPAVIEDLKFLSRQYRAQQDGE